MKVVVGSKNKTKVGAVEKVWKDATITSLSVPSGVSINEAVKLAKKFGTESSSSYINGVLSNFVKSL